MPMNLLSIEEAVAYAESRWPGFLFRIKGDEAHGPCPICGKAKEDGFILFENGGYFCRPGTHTGWLDEEAVQLSAEELRLRKIEAEQARQARKQRELEKRLSALERIAKCTDHLTYHQALDPEDRAWWHQQGINDYSIDEYQLGICYGCPLDPEHKVSMTIPVFDSTWSRLVNIRHRIPGAGNGHKYWPHIKGLPAALFNARYVTTESDLTLVEGEKKSIVVSQHGFPAVGIFGMQAFNLAWLQHFSKVKRLWIALDPDAHDKAWQLGKAIAKEAHHMEVRVVRFPVKPDDFFLKGGDETLFERHLSYGRLVV